MAVRVQFKIDGAKELDNALSQLPKATGKAQIRSALKKAAKPIKIAAEANAPGGPSGDIARSIIISTKVKARQRSQAAQAPAKGAVIFVGSTSPLAHLIEFGTQSHDIAIKKKSVLSDGNTFFGVEIIHPGTGARPFLRTAWDAHKKEAVIIFGREVWKNLERTAKRFAKQAQAGKLGKGATKFFRSGITSGSVLGR